MTYWENRDNHEKIERASQDRS